MVRFILCISVILSGLCVVGCSPSLSLKLAPDVIANAKEANSIIWGQIKVSEILDWDSKVAQVWVEGLLPVEKPLADITFREESTGKEFTTKISGNNFRLFACNLPEGKYRLIVEVKWPGRRIGTFVSDKTVTCAGDGQAINIGQLSLANSGSSLFLYHSTGNFETLAKRFLADNPEYTGEVKRQIIVSKLEIKS